jgi:hypothetical protein
LTERVHYVELKERLTDELLLEERARILDGGGVFEHQAPLGHQNGHAAVIKHAVKQLATKKIPAPSFCLCWIDAGGLDPDVQYQQIISTFYGLATLLDFAEVPVCTRRCFFFGESEFYRNRDTLDAAIVSTTSFATMLLNPYSERVGSVRLTRLANAMDSALIDPVACEREGTCFSSMDCLAKRKSSGEVLEFVRVKYRRPRLDIVSPTCHSADAEVKPNARCTI